VLIDLQGETLKTKAKELRSQGAKVFTFAATSKIRLIPLRSPL